MKGESVKVDWMQDAAGRWWARVGDGIPVRLMEPAQIIPFPRPTKGQPVRRNFSALLWDSEPARLYFLANSPSPPTH